MQKSTSKKEKPPPVWPQRIASAKNAMIATQHYRATEAGQMIFKQGGNAIDAAVAAAFALSVCEPMSSGLGGQTMITLRTAKKGHTIALDGSSRAPNRVIPGGPSRKEQLWGYKATTVPSTPAVLGYVLKHYGTMNIQQVLGPALELAHEGYRITDLQEKLASRELKRLQNNSAGLVFLKNNRRPHPAGSLLRQPALAQTLERLARFGIEDFYLGHIAEKIHEDMERHDGLLRKDDLAQIPWPVERRPVACRLGGLRVVTFPPPGAGRTLVEMIKILSNFKLEQLHFDTPKGAVQLAELIRRANLDRKDRPFDPNYYPQVEDRRMLSEKYTRLVARQVQHRLKTHGETTHLSAMDAEDNVVSLTQSIERVYGSFSLCPELGFLYNNYMSAFEYKDISHPYYLRPNAVPWASVAPTVLFRRKKPYMAIGSPGSERIASSILQVLLRLQHAPPLDAVTAPRLHCSVEGTVSLEASRIRSDIPELLQKYGFEIDVREPFSFYLGCVQVVVRKKHCFLGAADPRRDGSAGGV